MVTCLEFWTWCQTLVLWSTDMLYWLTLLTLLLNLMTTLWRHITTNRQFIFWPRSSLDGEQVCNDHKLFFAEQVFDIDYKCLTRETVISVVKQTTWQEYRTVYVAFSDQGDRMKVAVISLSKHDTVRKAWDKLIYTNRSRNDSDVPPVSSVFHSFIEYCHILATSVDKPHVALHRPIHIQDYHTRR